MTQRERERGIERKRGAGGQKGGGVCSVTAVLSTKHWHPSENHPYWITSN